MSTQSFAKFTKQSASKFPVLQPMATPRGSQYQPQQAQQHQTSRSNASFNSIFKLTKTSFKSPNQHKAGVMFTAARQKGGNKEDPQPGVRFKNEKDRDTESKEREQRPQAAMS